jgi:hypothetical protein
MHRARRDWEAADAEYVTGKREAIAGSEDGEFAILVAAQAEAAAVRGDLDSALSYSTEARDRMHAVDRANQLHVERICATVEALVGIDGGAQRLKDCRLATRTMGLRLWEARCLVALAVVEPDNSDEYLAEAKEIFDECGSKQGLAELEAARAGLLATAT